MTRYCYEGSNGGYIISQTPVRCEYCGCDIPDEDICTVTTGQNLYDFNYACPDCAKFERSRINKEMKKQINLKHND